MGNVDVKSREYLPLRIQEKVCMCPRDPTGWGWADLDLPVPKLTYWIHKKCGKPNAHNCVWECDDCDKLFVPKQPLKYPEFLIEVLCDECAGR